jgi:hypothetical protein
MLRAVYSFIVNISEYSSLHIVSHLTPNLSCLLLRMILQLVDLHYKQLSTLASSMIIDDIGCLVQSRATASICNQLGSVLIFDLYNNIHQRLFVNEWSRTIFEIRLNKA